MRSLYMKSNIREDYGQDHRLFLQLCELTLAHFIYLGPASLSFFLVSLSCTGSNFHIGSYLIAVRFASVRFCINAPGREQCLSAIFTTYDLHQISSHTHGQVARLSDHPVPGSRASEQ